MTNASEQVLKALTAQLKDQELKLERMEEQIYKIEVLNRKNDFSYIITKSKFLSCLGILKALAELEVKLYDLSKISLWDIKEIHDMKECLEDLLIELCNDNKDDFEIIGYFIYDLEWGKKYIPYCFTDENNDPIDISTEEKLWEYIYNNKIKNSNN